MQKVEALNAYSSQIEALFTLRNEGVSEGVFNSFNIAFHVGDNEHDVVKNRALLKAGLTNCVTLQAMQQEHSATVCCVDETADKPFADALISNTKGVALMVMVADCIPILMYDTKNRAIGAVHAGRAGALSNIVKNTFMQMNEKFGTCAKDLVISLGPAIGTCCYEVEEKEFMQAKEAGYEKMCHRVNRSYFMDIKGVVLDQIEALGVTPKAVENHAICTACNTQDFFSYRKEGKTGRFCGVIMIK